MTDLERLKQLLADWEVPYAEDQENYADKNRQALVVGNSMDYRTPDSDRVTGYIGFVTVFEFDLDGKFIRMGAWE